MKTLTTLTMTALLVFSANALAAPAKKAAPAKAPAAKQINFAKDVDGLGGNDDLMDMAARLHPETKSRIVQERLVDRHTRFEFGMTYGGTMGGTTYVQTQNVGASLDFHITPKWSIGARYYDYSNSLTPEGQRAFQNYRDAKAVPGMVATAPDIDSPQNAKIAVLNWYPIYGKINFFDSAIAQFDLYLIAGGGQIELASGNSTLLTAGTGFGLWMTKHLTARAEIRYQNYQDKINTGTRDINAAAATIGLGWIL